MDEPSVEATIAILRGLKERYEIHHGVEITDPAIVAAAELSHRYITDRFLPDKAIDLIDEAAARIKMEIDSKPEAMDRLDRRMIQLKIEREAVKKEKDDASRKRLASIEDEIARLEREYADMNDVWQAEKAQVAGSQHIKEEIDKVKLQMDEAKRKGDWQAMSELQYGKLPQLEAQLKKADKTLAAEQAKKPQLLRTQVGAEEIAEVVSRATGIPVSKMMQGERDKLLGWKSGCTGLIGRDEASPARVRCVRRSRSGLSDPNRPVWIVPVPGTHRGGQDRAHESARRIPVRQRPGDGPHRHVGVHGKAFGGEAHRRAARHRRLRGGWLPDGGRPSQTIFRCCCSTRSRKRTGRVQRAAAGARRQPADRRAGTYRRFPQHGHRDDIEPRVAPDQQMTDNDSDGDDQDRGDGRVKAHFRPEFINRIDEIVVFHPAGAGPDHPNIARIQLRGLGQRLAKLEIKLDVDDAALAHVAEARLRSHYGARPLKRAIQRRIENPLAKEILSGKYAAGDTVRVKMSGSELTFVSPEGSRERDKPGSRRCRPGSGPVTRRAAAGRRQTPSSPTRFRRTRPSPAPDRDRARRRSHARCRRGACASR